MSKKYWIDLSKRFQNTIPYFKELLPLTKSIKSAILFQQLEYWFCKMRSNVFWKYLSPLNEERDWYKFWDSWTEELWFTKAEFRQAFKNIWTVYKSKTEYMLSDDKFKWMMFCSYFSKTNHKTFYLRNSKLILSNIAKL